MAPPTTTQRAGYSCPPPSAHVVGNAFAHQYYNILHMSPDLADMFYHEDSVLTRPSGDGSGSMDCITTLPEMKAKIMEMAKQVILTEILSVDSQDSHEGGVTVLVTGRLTFTGGVSPLAFVQSFFLAPQKKGYVVRNDTFRYIRDHGTTTITATADVAVAALPVSDEKTLQAETEDVTLENETEENGFVLVDH